MLIKVVNMIPNSLSAETSRDSEPSISVNPVKPSQIVASAFTPDPMGSGSAPIYVSTDGGDTWSLIVVLPGGNVTNDTTLGFATGSNTLYAGILEDGTNILDILRKADLIQPGLMTILDTKGSDDQPHIVAATAVNSAGVAADRVYVGENDFNAIPASATVDVSLDAATAPPPAGFFPVLLDPRPTPTQPQDGAVIVPAVHPSGTVYAVYLGWRTRVDDTYYVTDVVIVRDDSWLTGTNPFNALVDPLDSKAGVRIVTNGSTPVLNPPMLLGNQRVGANLAIAVDPNNRLVVYVAWAEGKTPATFTIHLRRSLDGGGTWSADLRSVAQATNPGIAISNRSKVAFFYQKLHNPGTGNRWQTHVEISGDAFATSTDLILADVPDRVGAYTGLNPIGDYAGLVALGKNFYGVFSGFNTPDMANFPNGVTYQRNADFGTHVLADLSGNPVNSSIDPYFFKLMEVAVADDFYVRDWTDSTSSGDDGTEPSTHAVFFTTSDVWNRRGTLPGPFPNDQPSNENAGNGAGTLGDNWAFARIRRNAPASAGSQQVTARFLVSKLGTGSNFIDASSGDPDVTFPDPDPTVTFNAADTGPQVTPAYHWHLNPVASSHLCLAVEISAPNDPYVPPTLAGSAPGWPTTDLRIINDNNKAQRNMGLSIVPARGVGLSDWVCAIVHNAAMFVRDFELRFQAPERVGPMLEGARLEVIGGEVRGMRARDTLWLPGMLPGENRWVGLGFDPPSGQEGEILAVDFFEVVDGLVVNGFALGARLAPMSQVLHDRLETHRSVFTRMAAGFQVHGAAQEAEVATTLLTNRRAAVPTYMRFQHTRLQHVERCVHELIGAHMSGDPFSVRDALKSLAQFVESGQVDSTLMAHGVLLNKLDASMTMRQLAKGDVADILQNVRWQRALYTRVPTLAHLTGATRLRDLSDGFIEAYGNAGNAAYPDIMRKLLACFEETSTANPQLSLQKPIVQIQRSFESLVALQKAHRDYLLQLQRL